MERYKIEATLVPSSKKDMFQYRIKLFTADTKEVREFGLYGGGKKEVYSNIKKIWEGDYWTGTGWYKSTGNKNTDSLNILDLSNGICRTKQLKRPSVKDVLYSLLSSYDALNCPNYESFADNFGYGRDSIEGKKIYKACLKEALKLRSTLGEAEINRLKELLQDY